LGRRATEKEQRMGRVNLAAQIPVGPYPGTVTAGELAVTFTAADPSNLNEFSLSGHELLLAWNTDGSSTHTVTLHSTPDNLGRTSDITDYSIPPDTLAAFSFLAGTEGWIETDGKLYVDASDSAIEFAVLRVQR
jgi:hypothetical protein